jgi:uncharacterized protein YcbX
MRVGHVVSLHRYPVKSLGGESLASATVTPRGIPGDRAWAVRDEERGGIRGAKRFPELMTASARYVHEPALEGSSPAEVLFPDGTRFMTDDPEAASSFSRLVGAGVTFWPLRPADDVEHYRRGRPLLEDREQEARRVFARTPDEPLPNLHGFPKELVKYESIPGTYFDAYPILLITTSSLAHLEERRPDSRFDVRRFRPNVLIETSGNDPFPERAWIGRDVRIGSAVFRAMRECPRCAMTTHGFQDLPRDPGIMRTLVREADGNLGVYATVAQPGVVSVRDTVELLA